MSDKERVCGATRGASFWRAGCGGEIELPRAFATSRHLRSFLAMSLDAPQLLSIDGSPFSVGIAAARFNARLTDALLDQVVKQLRDAGVKKAVQATRPPVVPVAHAPQTP